MTHHTILKTSLFQLMAILFMLPFASCDTKPKETDTEEVAEDMNKPNDDATREKDEEFLMKAAEINLEEIQLGQLAQQKGTHADVKALGKMMEDAHTKALADVTALAGREGIAVPTSPTKDVQDAYQNLSTKEGADFDKDFCDKMVQGHKRAINLFENRAEESQDADIRSWASTMLPDLRNHLTHAEACEAKLKQM